MNSYLVSIAVTEHKPSRVDQIVQDALKHSVRLFRESDGTLTALCVQKFARPEDLDRWVIELARSVQHANGAWCNVLVSVQPFTASIHDKYQVKVVGAFERSHE